MSNATVASASKEENISLFFTGGGSDKVYHAQLLEKKPGYIISFQYGRRGSSLQSGTKTTTPVSYAMAKKIFEKLINEKKSKGYSTGESGVAYQNSEMEARVSGVLPQLLNALSESDVQLYLEDDNYILQKKEDGERRLLKHTCNQIIGINRKGLTLNLPASLTEIPQFIPSFLIDGEIISEMFYAFDLLELGDRLLVDLEYWERFELLKRLVAQIGLPQIVCVSSFEGYQNKKGAFERFQLNKSEGVVFKLLSAPYTPGRPESRGPQMKYKFTETASVLVTRINPGKRSVSISVCDGVKIVPVGNVTVPPNKPVPQPGRVCEVKYLYMFHGGSLFQPVYLGERDDLDASSCTIKQLKFKQENEEGSEE